MKIPISRSRWSLRAPFLTRSQARLMLLVHGIACRKEKSFASGSGASLLSEETMFHSASGFLCFFHVCFSWYLWVPVVEEKKQSVTFIVVSNCNKS